MALRYGRSRKAVEHTAAEIRHPKVVPEVLTPHKKFIP